MGQLAESPARVNRAGSEVRRQAAFMSELCQPLAKVLIQKVTLA